MINTLRTTTNYYKRFLLLALCGTFSTTALPMQTLYKRIATAQGKTAVALESFQQLSFDRKARALLSASCKVLGTGLAFEQTFAALHEIATDESEEELHERQQDNVVPTRVCQPFLDDMKQRGINHNNLVFLRQYKEGSYSARGTRTIFIGYDLVFNARHSPNNPLSKAILYHELSHLRHNDSRNNLAAYALTPFITHLALRHPLMVIAKKLPFAQPSLLRDAGTIAVGCGKNMINNVLISLYQRTQEQRADDEIPDDPALLQEIITYFAKPHSYHKKQLKEYAEFDFIKLNNDEYLHATPLTKILKQRTLAQLFTAYPDLYYYTVDPQHPSPEHRIARFKERLIALGAQPISTAEKPKKIDSATRLRDTFTIDDRDLCTITMSYKGKLTLKFPHPYDSSIVQRYIPEFQQWLLTESVFAQKKTADFERLSLPSKKHKTLFFIVDRILDRDLPPCSKLVAYPGKNSWDKNQATIIITQRIKRE